MSTVTITILWWLLSFALFIDGLWLGYWFGRASKCSSPDSATSPTQEEFNRRANELMESDEYKRELVGKMGKILRGD